MVPGREKGLSECSDGYCRWNGGLSHTVNYDRFIRSQLASAQSTLGPILMQHRSRCSLKSRGNETRVANREADGRVGTCHSPVSPGWSFKKTRWCLQSRVYCGDLLCTGFTTGDLSLYCYAELINEYLVCEAEARTAPLAVEIVREGDVVHAATSSV